MSHCSVCKRELIPGPSIDDHHLIPKTFKGREVITIHKICHQKIHSVFTERELANRYNSINLITSHPEIVKFIKWISKKDPEFYVKTKDLKDRKRKRRQ